MMVVLKREYSSTALFVVKFRAEAEPSKHVYMFSLQIIHDLFNDSSLCLIISQLLLTLEKFIKLREDPELGVGFGDKSLTSVNSKHVCSV